MKAGKRDKKEAKRDARAEAGMSFHDPERIKDLLWKPRREDEESTGAQIFAVLDGARDKRIPQWLGRKSAPPLRCLYHGDVSETLKAAAPQLVVLDRSHPFTAFLTGEGFGKSLGIYVESTAGMDELERHFRNLLLMKDGRGRKLVFRFYDPRVLRLFLPTCPPKDLDTFFGPVGRYAMDGFDEGTLVQYTRGPEGLMEAVDGGIPARPLLALERAEIRRTRDEWAAPLPTLEAKAPAASGVGREDRRALLARFTMEELRAEVKRRQEADAAAVS